MPRNRKYFPHNATLFVTSRTEEGLPLVPSYHMNAIIWGILARASSLYRVKVCHFVFMANHFHMMLVVEGSEDVSSFIGYIKAEIAHAVNKLLGRRQKTIWTKGYDSPVLLTAKDILKYINYIYLNPVRAGLVKSIGHYPGVSSWEMFSRGIARTTHKHFSRDSIPTLCSPAMSINEQKALLNDLMSGNVRGGKEEFVLEPYAWLESFSEYNSFSNEKVRRIIIDSLTNLESQFDQRREVLGSTALRRQSMLKEYTPKKHAQRMVCISSDIELRKSFICYYKNLCSEAAKIYCYWKRGVLTLRIPRGLFPPRAPMLVCDVAGIT